MGKRRRSSLPKISAKQEAGRTLSPSEPIRATTGQAGPTHGQAFQEPTSQSKDIPNEAVADKAVADKAIQPAARPADPIAAEAAQPPASQPETSPGHPPQPAETSTITALTSTAVLPTDPAPVTLVLCSATSGASWPQPLVEATAARASAPLAAAQIDKGEGHAVLWLGYTDPLESLARQLNAEPESDPLEQLERWVTEAEAFLKLKRDHPDQCRLVNLATLDDAMAAELLAELAIPAAAAPLPPQTSVPPLDPRLLVVLHHQQAAAGLYADLEACADLMGRQPNFSLPLPPLRSVGFAAQCLQSWQIDQTRARQLAEQRQQRRLSDQEHHLALAALQQQNDQAIDRIAQLSDERDRALERLEALKDELGNQQAAAAGELATLRAGISQTQAAAELTAMQLHHVHDALERLLAERDDQQRTLETEIAQQRNERERLDRERQRLHGELTSLQNEQEALHGEMLHFMMSSKASAQLERERIPRLTSLLRQALQLG